MVEQPVGVEVPLAEREARGDADAERQLEAVPVRVKTDPLAEPLEEKVAVDETVSE